MKDLSYLPDATWRVNSYGYPNPFGATNSRNAWTTFLSFTTTSSYSDLKDAWNAGIDGRRLSSNAVESWKAAFEEFGLLYVISGSNEITLTPAGFQLIEAVNNDDHEQFIWIGMNLLLRFPLRGPPRGRGSEPQISSDILLYRFVYSALLDLDNCLWWTEAQRLLCRTFSTGSATRVVEDVRALREAPGTLDEYPKVSDYETSSFYNALNQVFVHASMGEALLLKDTNRSYYGESEKKRLHYIDPNHLRLVRTALGGAAVLGECFADSSYVSRLPTAPVFASEEDYFDYLGAEVQSIDAAREAEPGAEVFVTKISNEQVFVLASPSGTQGTGRIATGDAATLCALSVGSRVIFADDSRWTYIVDEKQMMENGRLQLVLRRARPITDAQELQRILGEYNA